MKHTTKIMLYSSYFNANDNISAKSILNIFQDVAAIHAEEISVGYEAMLAKNLYWVLSRIKIDILKMPIPNQTVIVETWPHPKGRIDFDRDLKISDENGNTLIIGTSKWCVIDTVTRTLQRSDNVIYSGECITEKNYEDKFMKISVPDEKQIFQFNHTVMFSDLDHNKHMNNTNYALLTMNATQNKTFSHFEINFLNECKLGETISISTTKTANGEFVVGNLPEKTAFVAYIQ